MRMTVNTTLDFFAEFGYEVLKFPSKRGQGYLNPRLYYPGCVLHPDYLYLTDDAGYAQIDRTDSAAAVCVLGGANAPADDPNCFYLRGGASLPVLLEQLQARFELLTEWDRTLTTILNRSCSPQEILDCSAPILRNPCFFQDTRFQVLASSGTVSAEENAFFAGTVRDGHAPHDLFSEFLSAPVSGAVYSPPIPAPSIVRDLTQQRVYIADCCSDGVPVLHFCLAYTNWKGVGLRDLILHLLHRMETSPGIKRLASSSVNMQDHLFTRIIDAPECEEFHSICEELGLFRYSGFTVICYDFGTQPGDMISRMTKLRAIYSSFWFFRYRDAFYALCGENENKSDTAPEESACAYFMRQLSQLGAKCGVSLDRFPASALRQACAQASYACAVGGHTSYRDVAVSHMLASFYAGNSFRLYAPHAFLQMLDDDRRTGNNNLALLLTFLSHNCNATVSSRLLHMHRNNILYRIEKIRTNYGFRLDDPEERLFLLLLSYTADRGLAPEG